MWKFRICLAALCAGYPALSQAPGPATISVVDTFTATSGTTITRSSLNFGANDPGRIIVVALSFGSAIARAISSVTIGGVAASVAQDTLGGGSAVAGAAIYYAAPTGTSGQSVSVVFNNSIAGFSQVIYRVTCGVAAPYGGNKTAAGGTAATTVALSTAVPVSGVLIVSGRAQSAPGITNSYNGIDTLGDDLNGVVNASTYMQSRCLITENNTRNAGYTGGPGSNAKHVATASWR